MAYTLAVVFLVMDRNGTLGIILLFAGISVLLVLTFSGWLTRPGNYRRIQKNGIEANAVVLDIRSTGWLINNNPQVNLRLQVQPLNLSPYEISVKAVVSLVSIPRTGDTLRVKYDPDRPQDVIVV
jgi:hypothetical protein